MQGKVVVCALARGLTSCASIRTLNGVSLQWSDEIRYLGDHIICSFRFRVSLDIPKRSFYRAANSVFGKVGRVASEEVTIQLHTLSCILFRYARLHAPIASP